MIDGVWVSMLHSIRTPCTISPPNHLHLPRLMCACDWCTQTSFRNRKVRRWIKYYSPHWRTWAAVNIQLAWRRYKAQKAMMRGVGLESNGENSSERVTMRYSGQLGPMAEDATPSQREQDRIRLIAAIFRAPKPHD